jgi:phosphonate transport system permease protein
MIESVSLRWALRLGIVAYLAIALWMVDIDGSRIVQGLDRAATFFSGLLAPDFTSRWPIIQRGFVDSIVMTVTSTALGILLSIPVGLGAARNLAYRPIYLFCRALLAVSRAFHELVYAVIFVALFGYGPFAGVVTLVVATIGFLGKLLAEEIEAIDDAPMEAARATGADWGQRLLYAVLPQVAPRLAGLSMYRLDINFRASAIIGLVGAGGIGAALNTAFDRRDFGDATAILILIVVAVLAMEYLSSYIRDKYV